MDNAERHTVFIKGVKATHASDNPVSFRRRLFIGLLSSDWALLLSSDWAWLLHGGLAAKFEVFRGLKNCGA